MRHSILDPSSDRLTQNLTDIWCDSDRGSPESWREDTLSRAFSAARRLQASRRVSIAFGRRCSYSFGSTKTTSSGSSRAFSVGSVSVCLRDVSGADLFVAVAKRINEEQFSAAIVNPGRMSSKNSLTGQAGSGLTLDSARGLRLEKGRSVYGDNVRERVVLPPNQATS